MNKRLSGQGGVSVVEAPIVLIVVAFLALGVLAFVQVFRSYQHLTSATRAAARYATKADYDPEQPNAGYGTRPPAGKVVDFAKGASSDLETTWDVAACPTDDGTCTPNDNNGAPGQVVHVKGTSKVNDGAYTLISGLANGLASFFGGQVLPDAITIRSTAVAAYE